jgi:hypothetical protein
VYICDPICTGGVLLEQLQAPNAEYLLRPDPQHFPLSSIAALGSARSAATARGPEAKAQQPRIPYLGADGAALDAEGTAK